MLQIVYASRLVPGQAEDTLARIARQAQAANAGLGLTGILVSFGPQLVGLLEGEERTVLMMLERIATDPRHDRLTVLREAEIDAPRFVTWHFAEMPDYPAATAEADALQFGRTLSRRMAMFDRTPPALSLPGRALRGH